MKRRRHSKPLQLLGLVSSLWLVLAGCGGQSSGGGGSAPQVRHITLQLARSTEVVSTARNQGSASALVRQVQPGAAGFIQRLDIRMQTPQGVDLLPLQEFPLGPADQEMVTLDVVIPNPPPAAFQVLVTAFNNFNNRQIAIFLGQTLIQRGQSSAEVTLVRNPDPATLIPVLATPADLQQRVFTFRDGAVFGAGLGGTPVTLVTENFVGNTSVFALAAGRGIAGGQIQVTMGSCDFVLTVSTFPPGQGPQVGDRMTFGSCQVDAVDGRLITTNALITVSATSEPPGLASPPGTLVLPSSPLTLVTDEDTAGMVQIAAALAGSRSGGLTFVITESPAHGTAMVNNTGLVTYRPGAQFSGSDHLVVLVIATFTDGNTPPVTLGSVPIDITVTLINEPLTVSKDGTGSGTVTSSPAGISCGSTCSTTFTFGTSVTLTPTATSGSSFTGWSGDCTGTDACTVSMTQARSVTATFTAFEYSLTNMENITVTQGGSGTTTITATLVTGVSQAVTLAAVGLPAGATAAFAPTACTPTCTSTLTITTSALTPTGTFLITVTGTPLGRTTTFNLVVNLPPGACQPSSALSVLVTGTNVVSYVPKGHWGLAGDGATNVAVVNVEGSSITPQEITTPNVVNSCASNSLTGQTVCTANNTDVYVISGTTLDTTLTSAGSGSALFSHGFCTNCGVAMDAAQNKAVIALRLSRIGGYQYLDLGTSPPTFESAFASQAPSDFFAIFANISEGILIDPIRNLILSPNEQGNFEIVNVATTTSLAFFENAVSGAPSFDSAGEDCSTGIALAPTEDLGEIPGLSHVYIADLTQATFTPGSPGTWSAPSQVQTLSESSLPSGASGIAVAQGTHTGIVTGEFGGAIITAIALPTTSGSGTPAISDWVTCSIPSGFSTGADPHTVTAYQSPNGGHAIGLVANEGATTLAMVDLTMMLNPTIVPRTVGGHACAAGTLPATVVSTIAVP